jgi:hypothetical protein
MILGDWDFEKIHAGEKYIAELNNGKRHSLSVRWKVLTLMSKILARVHVGYCDVTEDKNYSYY